MAVIEREATPRVHLDAKDFDKDISKPDIKRNTQIDLFIKVAGNFGDRSVYRNCWIT